MDNPLRVIITSILALIIDVGIVLIIVWDNFNNPVYTDLDVLISFVWGVIGTLVIYLLLYFLTDIGIVFLKQLKLIK